MDGVSFLEITKMTGPLKLGQTGSKNLNKKLVTIGTAPVETVASQGTLTIAEAVTAEDTIVIGMTEYTFKADGTAANAGDIDMGADEAATKLNIVKAILGTDGINGANYLVSCAAAFSTDDLVLTAKRSGAAGDTISTTETFTGVTNVFDDVTLGTTTAGAGTVADLQAEPGDMVTDGTNLYVCLTKDDAGATTWGYTALTGL